MDETGERSKVRVSAAGEVEKALVENLFQFYLYDFSEILAGDKTSFGFNEEGRFAPYRFLGDYWHEDGRWPLLIRAGGELAGFALVNQRSHRDDGPVERNMAEFFIARKYRHIGVAAEAVRQILRAHPGQWEAAVMAANHAAKIFWPRAIASAPNVSGLRTIEGDGTHWRGPIYCFDAA